MMVYLIVEQIGCSATATGSGAALTWAQIDLIWLAICHEISTELEVYALFFPMEKQSIHFQTIIIGEAIATPPHAYEGSVYQRQ
jgi:hypothetical protein